MKKILIMFLLLFIIIWPQHYSDAEDSRPVIESLINYQIVKSQVLNYQIEKKLDSLINKN